MIRVSSIIKSLILLTVIGLVLVLNLINKESLNRFYVTVAGRMPVDANWVSDNGVLVSDVGHAISGFLMAFLIFLNVREKYYRFLIMLACFVVCCELMQFCTTTRQFSLLDVGYSLGGICFAICLFMLRNFLSIQRDSQTQA